MMILSYAFCNVPVMPLRSEPNHRAEQSSQLLFGEKAIILETNKDNWARISCAWDNYDGWCLLSQLTPLSKTDYQKETKFLCATHSNKLHFKEGDMHLPFLGEMVRLKKNTIKPMKEQGVYKGQKLKRKELAISGEAIRDAAMFLLNAPYQWGGRSVAGIDCSGLTQMAYKYCNLPIPRDASQQAMIGATVDFLENCQCGDLAFFDNKEGNINHVGIILDSKTIIHASASSGKVAIDHIDLGGIISNTLKKRTHQLRIVKRYF